MTQMRTNSYIETSQFNADSSLTFNVVGASLTAALGAFEFGFALGYPSPTATQLQHQMKWNDELFGWFSSLSCIGGLVGALLGIYTIEKFGRKFNMMLFSLLIVAGWVILATAEKSMMALIGRTITGVALGISTYLVPLYIAEISPAKFRGRLVSLTGVGITFGILMSYILGALLKWRWLAITGAGVGTTMCILMLFHPETPRWLVKHGKIEEARTVLMNLRKFSYEQCETEFCQIKNYLDNDEKVSFRELSQPTVIRPLIISLIVVVLQQLSGVNAVCNYASKIASDSGMKSANLVAVVIGFVQFIGTVVSCVIIDKLGRRKLLIYPCFAMFLSMTLLGTTQYFKFISTSLILLSLCVYLISFALGMGSLSFIVIAEILPTRISGVASGVASQINWICSFIVIKTYIDMEHAIHAYGCYWVYASVCFISAIFVYAFLPETKGKTLEEIRALFVKETVSIVSTVCSQHSNYRSCNGIYEPSSKKIYASTNRRLGI